MPIAASIVDGRTYVYGLVDTSPYKVSIRIDPEQYVVAMSGEPITVKLSDNEIREPKTNWEDISLFAGLFLLFLSVYYLGASNGTKPYNPA